MPRQPVKPPPLDTGKLPPPTPSEAPPVVEGTAQSTTADIE